MLNQHREPQKRICGCQAACKGLKKPVSLSTYNRHQKHRNEESFSVEFRGFLASSSAEINQGSQREASFDDIPESEAESAALQVHDTEMIIDGNEEGDIGTGTEDLQEESWPTKSTNVRFNISVSQGWNYSPVKF